MHLAFSWSVEEGLWVFMDGELLAANKVGVLHSRDYDRYSRITLGRNNANNAFSGFIGFAFQEIVVYFRFTVTYRIREIFALAGEYSVGREASRLILISQCVATYYIVCGTRLRRQSFYSIIVALVT